MNISSYCISCNKLTSQNEIFNIKGFPIIKCSKCGLGSTLINNNFQSKSIYNESYFNGNQEDGYCDYQGSKDLIKQEFKSIRSDILKNKTYNDGKLLEIGCAYGYFLELVKSNFSVTGLEICDHAVNECHKRGLNVYNADDDINFITLGQFDVVVMLDVIEHLTDPIGTIDKISKCTKPGSLLIITTGDFGSLCSVLLKQYWRLMTPPQHLWFFNKLSITSILKRYGFKVESIKYPFKLVSINLIIYQLARYIGLQKFLKKINFPGAVPINLFDAMRIIARRI